MFGGAIGLLVINYFIGVSEYLKGYMGSVRVGKTTYTCRVVVGKVWCELRWFMHLKE